MLDTDIRIGVRLETLAGVTPFFRGFQRIFQGSVIRSLRFSDVSAILKLDDRFLPSTPKDMAQAGRVGFTHAVTTR
jgi:hypothetical protein